MSSILSFSKSAGLAAVLVCGAMAFSNDAQAHGYSQPGIRSAQRQLKNDGYYHGRIDGRDGRMTRAAIRKYQAANNLAVNGRLDRETRSSLSSRTTGEASRSQTENNAMPTQPSTVSSMTNSATIGTVQRDLQQKGLYNGNIDGQMGPQTASAIRTYQKNNNLNVTGRLDSATLNSLGVSK